MLKVAIVVGPPLVGKTQYIQAHYAPSSGYYYLDFASEYKSVTGSLDDFPESDDLLDVYQSAADKLLDEVIIGGKNLVFEYCTGYKEMDEDLEALICLIRETDAEISLVQLTAEFDTVMERKEAVLLDPDYVASYFTNEPVCNILTGFFEDLPGNRKALRS